MRNTQLHPTRVSGSTRLGALIGVVAGVALTSFLLLDPLDLHGVDDRLRGSFGDHNAHSSSSDAEVQLWTCGMHPNVIQDEPGTCPICQMDLVPLRHEPTPAATEPATTVWTCPMHNVISEPEAGECPICGMDLVPVVGADAHAEHGGRSTAEDGPEVTIDRSMVQKMNVRFAEVERRDLKRRISTVGNLDYDEERMVSVTTRYSGFIEKVFVNHVGQPVRRGDPLFEVYSPELVQTQRELISAVSYAKRFHQPSTDVRARAEALVEAARTRLEYWEIPADRVAEIEATGAIHRTLTVFAPSDGVVIQRMHGLDKAIVAQEVNFLERLGVTVECNAVVGRTVTLDELFEEGYEAVYIGVGAGLPRFMNIPGENLIGILSANEYLTRANLMKAYLYPEVDTPIPRAKNVVVLGAGNVAMDSARTAMRLGADKVRIVYRRSRQEMPARIAEIHHAEEEGIEFFLLTNPTRYLGNEKGRLTGMECLKMELGEPDESGRRRPVPIKGSEFELECDMCVVAVGSGANPLLTESTPDLKLNKWGYIDADPETGTHTKKGSGPEVISSPARPPSFWPWVRVARPPIRSMNI